MRLADSFKGKDGGTLSSLIAKSKIVEIVEISSASEATKKLDEIKKVISKSSGTFTVIAFKQQEISMNIIHNQNVAFRCPNTLKQKLQNFADENDLRMSAVIRNACVDYLRKQMPTAFAPLSPASFAELHLKELSR